MEIEELREQADKCRHFATCADPLTRHILLELADQYETEARLQTAYPALPPSNRQ
jgi:hypothetical protein